MKKIYNVRQIIISIMASCILTWAFFKNQIMIKIVISPFLICSVAIFFENLFLLLNKTKISNVFKFIFRISFFVYAFVFLAYAVYYAIVNKNYGLFIIIGIFAIVIVSFFKAIFLKKDKKQ